MRKKLIAGAAGLALASGIGLGMTQMAQAETPAPTPSTSSSTAPGDTAPTTHRHEGRWHGGKGLEVSALATKLGLPEATVANALSAVRDQVQPATRPSPDATTAEREATQGARQAGLAKALAAELKIDEAKVTTALTELRTERLAARTAHEKATLDTAVADGKLTRTEADAVQKAIDADIVSTRGGGHGRR
ncbi:MAG: hypothetical protein ABIS84_00110 [Arachnia sp.]